MSTQTEGTRGTTICGLEKVWMRHDDVVQVALQQEDLSFPITKKVKCDIRYIVGGNPPISP